MLLRPLALVLPESFGRLLVALVGPVAVIGLLGLELVVEEPAATLLLELVEGDYFPAESMAGGGYIKYFCDNCLVR